jgi:hypothetical protein
VGRTEFRSWIPSRALATMVATAFSAGFLFTAAPAQAADVTSVETVPVIRPIPPPPLTATPPTATPAPATPAPEPLGEPSPTDTPAGSPADPPTPRAAPEPADPTPGAATPSIGYDISWPQCASALPQGQAFGIVGVNGGLANNTNPCLADQLAWARTSLGGTSQPPLALYVNTANPAAGLATWWPSSNTYPAWSPTPVPNPYGQCTGGDTPACSYVYGYAKAWDNATIRGVPDPASHFWWLDVETENSWGPDPVANRAALEGMAHYYLDVLGVAGLGIYSTGYQWTRIVGGIGPVWSGTESFGPSNLNGLPSWLAGATSLAGAQANCSAPALTGGLVTMTQYVMNDLDHNHSCR